MTLADQLISPLERLIDEHASAAILQKHLASVRSQLTNYEAKYKELEAENAQLEVRFQQAKSQARELENRLAEIQSEFHCHCKGI
jgi:predicted nuclease with TOPRIM domain